MSNYRRANRKAQWFQDNYPGARMNPNVVVLHTTEGTSWPSYSGGAVAPNYTAKPAFFRKRLTWRAHFPDERSARALENASGGVETNTLNAVQVELVGTCDPATHRRWGRARHIFWPDAPDWALRDVARFLADQHERHGTKLDGPRFLAYPASYGDSPVRMSGSQWRNFYGVCGHQHVPENHHGDPGAFPIGKTLRMARRMAGDAPARKAGSAPKPAPEPEGPSLRERAKGGNPKGRVDRARAILRIASNHARNAFRRSRIRRALRKYLPKR